MLFRKSPLALATNRDRINSRLKLIGFCFIYCTSSLAIINLLPWKLFDTDIYLLVSEKQELLFINLGNFGGKCSNLQDEDILA